MPDGRFVLLFSYSIKYMDVFPNNSDELLLIPKWEIYSFTAAKRTVEICKDPQ